MILKLKRHKMKKKIEELTWNFKNFKDAKYILSYNIGWKSNRIKCKKNKS